MKRIVSLLFAAMAFCFTACNPEQEEIPVDKLSVDPSSLSLYPGDTRSLAVVVEPSDATDKDVVWSSGDDTVATVDQNGEVTAVAPGTVRITAALKKGDLKAYCTVTVSAVKATSVTVSPETLTLEAGSTGTLSALVAPENVTDKGVVWSSDKKAIATVDDNGVVTAVSPGTAIIYAKAVSDKSVKGECKVSVVEKTIHVTGISISKPQLELAPKETETLTVTVQPANATDKSVSWSSSDEKIAKVSSSGLVTAVADGSATITATTTDGSYKAVCAVKVVSYSITFTQAPDNCILGETVTYKVKTTGPEGKKDNIQWKVSSQHPEVLRLGNQPDKFSIEMKAVGVGTATVTAGINNFNVAVSTKCTVKGNVTGVKITYQKDDNMTSEGVVHISVGETTYRLKATCEGYSAGKINWKSDDKSVVEVMENGLLNPLKATVTTSGATFVRVWAVSEDNPEAKDYVKVYVYSKPTSISCTTLTDDSEANLIKADDTRKYEFKILPSTARQFIRVKDAPDGWTVSTGGTELTVTSPKTTSSSESVKAYLTADVKLTVVSISDKSAENPFTLTLIPCQYYASDPKPFDYVYYSGGSVRFSDGGLRTFDYKFRKLSVKPKYSDVVGIITQCTSTGNNSIVKAMAQAWPEAFCGLSGASNMHGAAVALRNASDSSVWSQDHDEVATSSNWECTLRLAEDRYWAYSKTLSVSAFNYNEKRGSSHDIKAYEAVHEYYKSQFTTIRAFHWVLPTATMYLVGQSETSLFSSDVLTALNENITAAGGTKVEKGDYWSVNTNDKTNALVVGLYKRLDKNTKLPVRAWFVF